MNRRTFLKSAALSLAASSSLLSADRKKKPNIILLMADDQGWGDTGYNGHPYLKTPNLDYMAAHGVRFNRFYAGAPVCSPTRGSCLTGRHPFRYGIYTANAGHMKPEEVTLAEVLKESGYTTGHFGKWHLGTLTKTVVDANRGGPRGAEHYSPPWQNGFDVCFSTESKVPTWDPMVTPGHDSGDIGKRTPGEHFGTYYWTGPGKQETENLDGDDSRIIMERAIPFVERAAEKEQPFFAVIWFHAPHLPVLAGEKYRALYKDFSIDEQHFYGCITALDEQVGRLLSELKALGIAENTMIWYASDNGPEGKKREGKTQGRTGGLRGRKRDLFEGGIRVPGILYWPGKVHPKVVDVPCSTLDYYPTVLAALGITVKGQVRPIDGMNIWPIINGKRKLRGHPIGFESAKQLALIDDRFKIVSVDNGESYMMFDILADPGETNDILSQNPELAAYYINMLNEWRESCRKSDSGGDYS